MSSSDSNDNDNLRNLQSSVDPQFNYSYQSQDENKLKLMSSNRPNRCASDDSYNELNTTPQFRKHVAKKLTEIIDRQIKIIDKSPPKMTVESEQQAENIGIRLLSTCNHFTSIESEQLPTAPTKRYKRKTTNDQSSSDEDVEKLSSVAVSCDWVMKGSAPYQLDNNNLSSKTKSKKKKKKHKKSD